MNDQRNHEELLRAPIKKPNKEFGYFGSHDPCDGLVRPIDLLVLAGGYSALDTLMRERGKPNDYRSLSEEVFTLLERDGAEFLGRHEKELRKCKIPVYKEVFWRRRRGGREKMENRFWRFIGRLYMAYRCGMEEYLHWDERIFLGERMSERDKPRRGVHMLMDIRAKPRLKVKIKIRRDPVLGKIDELVLVPPRKPRTKIIPRF